jgi:hypothetical protein
MAPNNKRTGQNNKTWKPPAIKTTPGAGRRTNPKAQKPKPTSKPTQQPAFKDGQIMEKEGNRFSYQQGQWLKIPPAPVLPAPVPRSPAVSAPIHAAPKAFGSAYAPQAGAAPRPNTPQPASTAPNPFAPIGDVRGQALGSTQVDPNAALTAGTQQYGGQKLQGIDQNGIDMERRRAFLDANDSMSGMQAVRNLLNKRKLSISVSD